MKANQNYKYSVNAHGEYRARVGKGEQEALDYKIKNMIVEGPEDEKMLPPIVRDKLLEVIKKKINRKATAIRLFTITSVTRLGKVSSGASEVVKVGTLDDMDAPQLIKYARDNEISLPAVLKGRTEILQYILTALEDGDAGGENFCKEVEETDLGNDDEVVDESTEDLDLGEGEVDGESDDGEGQADETDAAE